jgi:hypothetical protein
MRPLALVLGLLLFAPALSAQGGATTLVPISEGLLLPAEEEPIACTRRIAQDALRVQRQPGQRNASYTGEYNPVTWQVSMGFSGRTITILTATGYRPREVSLLGATENVQARFLTDGSLQDGRRVVTPPTRDAGPSTPVASGLDSLDAPQLYALARELVYRCDRGIFDPVPAGNIQGRIPPQ